MPSRAAALTRVYLAVAGRAALVRALPLYAGIGVVAAVLFTPNGMTARTLVAAMESSRATRLVLWGAWLGAGVPIARALLAERPLLYLRALPVPRSWWWAMAAALLLAAQAPWILLFARGAGAAPALAATVAAAAGQALLAARSLRLLPIAAAAGLATALVIAAPAAALLGVGLLAGGVGVVEGWRRAAEQGAGQRRPHVGGPAAVALGLAHLAAVKRADGSVLSRVAVLALAGGGLAALLARRDPSSAAAVSLAVGAVSLAAATGAVAAPIAEAERRARWLLDATGTSGLLRVVAAGLATLACGAAAGLLHGLLVAWGAEASVASAARLAAGGALWGGSLALVAARAARWAERPDGVDGTRVVVALAGAAALALVAAVLWGEHALPALAGLSVALAATSVTS